MSIETISALLQLLREVEDGYTSAVLALFTSGDTETIPDLFRFPKPDKMPQKILPAAGADRQKRQDWSRVKDYAKLLGSMVTWVEANRAVIRNLETLLSEMQKGEAKK